MKNRLIEAVLYTVDLMVLLALFIASTFSIFPNIFTLKNTAIVAIALLVVATICIFFVHQRRDRL